MTYKTMLTEAKAKGVTSEKMMWKSVDDVDAMLCVVKETDEDAYWRFLRKTYGMLYDKHYATKDFAERDVEKMHSTQKDGTMLSGAYWTAEQVKEAYKDKSLPSGVTKWDLFVAANAAKHDFGKDFSDEDVLRIAWDFYFADEDFEGNDKIWRYMCMR